MASRKDIDSASAAELALVDLLYGELEGEEEQAAQQTVEADATLAEELDALRGLRALMSELPDQEPPSALTAKLLHAAAENAPARATDEEAGFFAWFRRLFQPVMMHPALSAAATLVLVAGVAGALYVSGRVSVHEPRALSEQANAKSELHRELRPVGTAAAAPDMTVPAATPIAGDSPTPTQQAPETAADDGVISFEMKEGEKGEGKAAPARASKTGKVLVKPPQRARDLATDGEADEDSAKDRGGAEYAGKKSPETERPDSKPTDKKADKASEAAPNDDWAGPTTGGAAGETIEVVPRTDPALKKPGEKPKKEENTRQLAEAKQLHDRALRAAKDGECDAVISLGARIRKLDATYYKKSFLTDPRLRSCRQSAPNAFE